MRILKKSEIVGKSNFAILIYGQSGIGKTTFAGGNSQDTILFDFDNGAWRAMQGRNYDVAQEVDFGAVKNFVLSKENHYKNIVFDTGSKLIAAIQTYVKTNNSRLALPSMSLKMYGEINMELKSFINSVLQLNKNIVFVCQREVSKNGEVERFTPVFGSDKNYSLLIEDIDLCGYLEKVGNDRVITFEPNERSEGKNTLNIPVTKIGLETSIYDLLPAPKVFTKEEIIEALSEIETVDTLNKFFNEWRNKSNIGDFIPEFSNAKKLLTDEKAA
jgi:hypothetical protein